MQTLEESLSLASKTDEISIVEKLREEVACFTNDFGKLLEISKTSTTLLKFHQHPHDKSGLGFEKGTAFSKSQFVSDKCDLCGKFGHSKFRCIHKKKQMSKGTKISNSERCIYRWQEKARV